MEQMRNHDIIGHMIRADHRHRAVCDRELAFLGLHRSQLRMLIHLWHHNGIMSQKCLAEDLHISAAVVTVTAKKLEADGYVTRTPAAEDKRNVMLSLTARGQETVDAARGKFDYVDTLMLKGFTEDEKHMLVEFYTRMLANLTSNEEGNDI